MQSTLISALRLFYIIVQTNVDVKNAENNLFCLICLQFVFAVLSY